MPRLPERMRIFLAVPLPKAIKDEVKAVQARLHEAGIALRWTQVENLHLTLLFFGETRFEQVTDLSLALREHADELGEAFQVAFAGVGAFPNLERARVLWLGLREGAEAMVALHRACAGIAEQAGCRYDRKRFAPHLTLGRHSDRGGHEINLPERFREVDAGEMSVDRVVLYRSDLDGRGPAHTELCTARLG